MGGVALVLGTVLMPVPWIRIGSLVVFLTLFGTFMYKSGAKSVQADWDHAENVALEAQIRLREIAEDERDVANGLALESQIKLEGEELNSARLKDELQVHINREKLTTTFSVSAKKDGCPVVVCNLPDVNQFFRLYNCGTHNESCETVPDADIPDISDGRNTGANGFTFLDGYYGRDNRDRSF